MEKTAFTRWLHQALSYFERKEPSDETVDLWFQTVREIPAEALPWLYQELIGLEAWPRNLPGFLQTRVRNWPGLSRQTQPHCECHRGTWEVAFWRPELDEWAIFSLPCGSCNGGDGPARCDDLLHPRLYDREPDRYMAQPPPWALIYPDQDSLAKKRGEILAYLAYLRKHRQRQPRDRADFQLAEDLPF
jgi:hypothetical protein